MRIVKWITAFVISVALALAVGGTANAGNSGGGMTHDGYPGMTHD